MSEAASKKGKLTGWHVLIIFGVAFSIVFATNFTFIWLALTSFTGMTDDHPYEDGLAYNEVLAERAAQEDLGWTATLSTVEEENGDITISVALHDASDLPVGGADVTLTFWRPTNQGMDTEVALQGLEPGLYTGEVQLPARGNWDVRGAARRDEGEALDFETRIWIE